MNGNDIDNQQSKDLGFRPPFPTVKSTFSPKIRTMPGAQMKGEASRPRPKRFHSASLKVFLKII